MVYYKKLESISKLVQNILKNTIMWKNFYIKPNEIGILYHRSDFKKVLQPGEYTYFGRHWQIKTYDLNEPEAEIENLELLLRNHRTEIEQYLLIVKTTFNEVALVRLGQNWISVAPNQLRAFWRGFIEVESHLFNLEENWELANAFVQQLRSITLNGLKKFQIFEYEIGLLYQQNNFIRPLEPGEYAFWSVNKDVTVRSISRIIPNPDFPLEDILIEKHPDFVAAYCEIVELRPSQVAIVRYRGKVISILPPTSRKLFWQGVEVEIVDISTDAKLPPALISELVEGTAEVKALNRNYLHICQVPPQHIGLLYINHEFQTQLQPALNAWWVFGRSFNTEIIDLRLQNMEISGQEILSKDKVPLRLNLTAGFRIQDILKAKNGLSDISGFLYKELQFALRGAVGERTLDALLEDKGAIDQSISEYIRDKASEYGIEVDSVGVKDIIYLGKLRRF